MNLPNRLTVLRLIVAPLFFAFWFLPDWFVSGGSQLQAVSAWALLVLFIVIELSDLFDGIIARKRGLITDLGKVLDPFADVISRITYFVCLSYSRIMPLWVLLVILYRELGITFLRMIMMGQGTAMAASWLGKSKAVCYAVSAFCGMAYVFAARLNLDSALLAAFYPVLRLLFGITAAVSLFSFISYWRNALRSGVFKNLSR